MNERALLAAALLAAAACSRRAGFSVPDLDDAAVVAAASMTDIAVRVPAYGLVLKNGDVEVNIEAADSKLVHPGQEAVAAAEGRAEIPCRVSRVLLAASAETGQSLAWLTPARGSGAAANDFASAYIMVAKKRVLAVPKAAVLIRDGATYAVRVDSDAGKTAYAPVPVATGVESDSLVEVLSGLKAGDRVVVQGGIGALSPDFKAGAGD